MNGCLLLVLVVLFGLGVAVGWFAREDDLEELDSAVETDLEALRAATRLNLAFWQAREELQAEADRHRDEDGRPR